MESIATDIDTAFEALDELVPDLGRHKRLLTGLQSNERHKTEIRSRIDGHYESINDLIDPAFEALYSCADELRTATKLPG